MSAIQSTSPSKERPAPSSGGCWRIVDVGLIVAFGMATLCFGGRHDLGRLIYISGAALACIGWCMASWVEGQRLRPSKIYTVFAGAIAVVLLQLITLPDAAIDILAPAIVDFLPAWSPSNETDLTLGHWERVSIAPSETRLGLAMLVAHISLFVVVLHRVRNTVDLEVAMRWVAGLAGGMAVLGLVQWATSNGKLLWVYEHPSRTIGAWVQGAFANRNHFAHYIILGIPALIVLAIQSLNESHRPQDNRLRHRLTSLAVWIWPALLTIAVVAVLLARSRGGLATLLVATGCCLALMWRHRLLRWKSGPLPLAIFATACGAVLIVGQSVFDRVTRLASSASEGELAAETGRSEIWQANVDAFFASPWLGWGAGSHRFVYKLFFDSPSTTEFTHAESGFLQIASESGLAGLAVLASAVTLAIAWACRLAGHLDQASSRLACACVPPLVASLVHSLVDFVWYVPACAGLTLVAAVVTLRLVQLNQQPKNPVRSAPTHHWRQQLFWPSVLCLGTIAAAFTYLGPGQASLDWDRYLKVSRSMKSYTRTQVVAHPEDALRHRRTLAGYGRQMLTLLKHVVANHPGHIEANRQLASRSMQLFELTIADAENGMNATQLRDTATASRFSTHHETKAWLHRAIGDRAALLVLAHQQAQCTLQLCPLIGNAYLITAELSCLSPSTPQDHLTLINQAVAVRPTDGRVLFHAGRLAGLEHKPELTRQLWRRSCKYPGSHWQALAALVSAGSLSPREFLHDLAPPWRVMAVVAPMYRKVGPASDVMVIADYCQQLANQPDPTRSPLQASRFWLLVGDLYQQVGQSEQALQCAENASNLEPYNVNIRRRLVKALMSVDRFAEADPHARWCLARRPSDGEMLDALRKLSEQRRLEQSRARTALKPDKDIELHSQR